MSEIQPVDPAHFLRSFLVVAGFYVLLFLGLLIGMFLIARWGFPDVIQLWLLDEIAFEQAWEQTPELFFPTGLCTWMIVLAAGLSIFIGMQVAFWAPFSKSGHGIFLAIICICTYLQISMTQPEIPKWMMMGMLVISPTMIVVASRLCEKWFGGPRVEQQHEPEDRDAAEPAGQE